MNEPSQLQHIGILGMHWGRRKVSSASSEDHIVARQLNKKKLNEMSNAEIQKLTTRINLEGQYRALHPSKIARGKKYVAGAIAVFGTAKAAYVFGNKVYNNPKFKDMLNKTSELAKALRK